MTHFWLLVFGFTDFVIVPFFVTNTSIWYTLDHKQMKPDSPKGNQPWVFIGRTDAEAEGPVFGPPDMKSRFIGKDPDAEKDWGQEEEKGVTENKMGGWHHWLNGPEFEQAPEDGGQRSLVCCSPWGHTKSDTT